MGNLQEGDEVFDESGKPTKVEFATDVMYGRKCYDVVFSDGSIIRADAEHLWVTTKSETPLTTETVKATLKDSSGRNAHGVCVCSPVQYPEKALPIDPYVLGAWLGDGTCVTGVISSDDPQILDEIRGAGYTVTKIPSGKYEHRIVGLTKQLRLLGILDNKHVPARYLRGSVEQRLALLRGLMDTDGTISKLGHCSFDNMNSRVADAVQELCASLGIKCTRKTKVAKLYGRVIGIVHRVFFTTDVPVFRLARKLERLRSVGDRVKVRVIVDVLEAPSVPVRCIRVANPRHQFLVGRSFIPTHNTYGSTIALVKNAWSVPNSTNWWVAPTFSQSKMAYQLVLKLLPKGTYVEKMADLRIILLKPDNTEHSVIEFKSGDNPDSLRGFGVNFFIMDEAARCPYDSFVSLWTTVTQTYGKGFFISTPKGRGWFYDIYQRGEKFDKDGMPRFGSDEEDEFSEWLSIRMPTWANPWVKIEAVRDMKRNLPEDVFRQEVAAQFLLESAGVFNNIKNCVRGVLQAPIPGHTYVMGVDLARLKDFSVLTVMDREQKHVVYLERFNQIRWEVQYARMIDTARRYNNALAVMDSTGIGDPIVETIKGAGVRVEPYKIGGSAAKQQLIEKLRVNVENGVISFPHIPILIRELEYYEYSVSDSGAVKYAAPSGTHDDCVISLALANWGVDTAPWVYRHYNVRGI